MRDFILLLFVFGCIPIILIKPFIGVLLYSWISIMNPHRFTWGFAYDFPFAAIIAAVTLIGLVFYKGNKSIPWNGISISLLLFVLWMCITTFFAFFPELAVPKLVKVLKIEFMVFVSMILLLDREKIRWFIWVIVLSIGLVGIKGGLFVLLTAGEYRVWGPGGFIEGNNEFGIALVMILPLMRYLQLQESSRWIKWGLTIAMVLCIIAVIGTYSRGALLALFGTAVYLWWKSPKKIMAAILLFIGLSVSFVTMPQKWFDRMDTISEYRMDESALGRLFAWKFATNIALDRPVFGGGFDAFDNRVFKKYAPPDDILSLSEDIVGGIDAHSIFFKILGEHSFIGLGLFISLILITFAHGRRIIKKTKIMVELTWARQLASMLQVSLIPYLIGGAFLGLSYFDLFYNLVAIMCMLSYIVAKQVKEIKTEESIEMDQNKLQTANY